MQNPGRVTCRGFCIFIHKFHCRLPYRGFAIIHLSQQRPASKGYEFGRRWPNSCITDCLTASSKTDVGRCWLKIQNPRWVYLAWGFCIFWAGKLTWGFVIIHFKPATSWDVGIFGRPLMADRMYNGVIDFVYHDRLRTFAWLELVWAGLTARQGVKPVERLLHVRSRLAEGGCCGSAWAVEGRLRV